MSTPTLEMGSGGPAIQSGETVASFLDSILTLRTLPPQLHEFVRDCLIQAEADHYEITVDTIDDTIEECSRILLHGDLDI